MCRAISVAALFVALLAVAAALTQAEHSVTEEHAGLRHTVVADSAMYCIPDTVSVSYTVVNVSGETLYIPFGELGHPVFNCAYDPALEFLWCDPPGGLPEVWWDTLAPGEMYALASEWDMRDYSSWPYQVVDEPGTYTLRGEFGTFDPDLGHAVALPVELIDGSTGAEELSGSWGVIKCLYR